MKTMLKKILFISLFFSAVVPSTMQANLLNWAALKSGAIKIGNKAANWLSANGGDSFNFLKKHSIPAIGLSVGSMVGAIFLWEKFKKGRERKLNNKLQLALKNRGMDEEYYGWNRVLISVAHLGHLDIVKLLLAANKVEVNIQNNKNGTALMLAAKNGYSNIVELLLKYGADVNLKDGRSNTALMVAAFNGHLEIVELLLAYGADANIQNNKNGTALMCATYNGYLDIVRLLLNHDADVNIQNKRNDTALMWAADRGRSDIVELLLAHGAKVNI